MEFSESDKKKLSKRYKEGYELVEIVTKNNRRYAVMRKNEDYIAVKLSKSGTVQ